MQDTSPTSSHWASTLLYAIASSGAVGLIVRLLTLWQYRGKPAAEIHESEARVAKTTAEARKINAEAMRELDEIIQRLHTRTYEMQLDIDEIRDERDDLKTRVDLQVIELGLRDKQIDKLMSVMKLRGIKLSDFDHR